MQITMKAALKLFE